MGWIKHSHPNVDRDSAFLAQVPKKSLRPTQVKEKLITTDKQIKKHTDLGLQVSKLRVQIIQMLTLIGTSFANATDHQTQLGFLLFPFYYTNSAI